MKRKVLYISIIYALTYLALLVADNTLHLALTNLRLGNILTFGSFFVPLMPIVWLLYIKLKWLRVSVLVIYCACLVPLYFYSLLLIMFTFNDITINNGFRPVFEADLRDGGYLVIYRTPDLGAFGGDYIAAARVRKIFPGLIKREFLPKESRVVNLEEPDYVQLNNKRIEIPKEDELRQKGNIF